MKILITIGTISALILGTSTVYAMTKNNEVNKNVVIEKCSSYIDNNYDGIYDNGDEHNTNNENYSNKSNENGHINHSNNEHDKTSIQQHHQ